ncbi:hypothetical protein COO60DRAFT_1627589 [Scenedesmus sp. NREL 46B-D3]|nr:hypothetical protein COO60DRAFT_1627589 [Scenedesmus sp. NREL 46B-D3]
MHACTCSLLVTLQALSAAQLLCAAPSLPFTAGMSRYNCHPGSAHNFDQRLLHKCRCPQPCALDPEVQPRHRAMQQARIAWYHNCHRLAAVTTCTPGPLGWLPRPPCSDCALDPAVLALAYPVRTRTACCSCRLLLRHARTHQGHEAGPLEEVRSGGVRSGNYGKAADRYSAAISLLGPCEDAALLRLLLSNRSAAWLKAGRQQAALDDAAAAVRAAPRWAKAQWRRGRALAALTRSRRCVMTRWPEALAAFLQAWRLSESGEACQQLVRLHMHQDPACVVVLDLACGGWLAALQRAVASAMTMGDATLAGWAFAVRRFLVRCQGSAAAFLEQPAVSWGACGAQECSAAGASQADSRMCSRCISGVFQLAVKVKAWQQAQQVAAAAELQLRTMSVLVQHSKLRRQEQHHCRSKQLRPDAEGVWYQQADLPLRWRQTAGEVLVQVLELPGTVASARQLTVTLEPYSIRVQHKTTGQLKVAAQHAAAAAAEEQQRLQEAERRDTRAKLQRACLLRFGEQTAAARAEAAERRAAVAAVSRGRMACEAEQRRLMQ